ncbi:hypothetical protein OAO12_00260 [Methylophilaceae bacterium]|nr:hypothetical protein [Methylophilaceae bacterium]
MNCNWRSVLITSHDSGIKPVGVRVSESSSYFVEEMKTLVTQIKDLSCDICNQS